MRKKNNSRTGRKDVKVATRKPLPPPPPRSATHPLQASFTQCQPPLEPGQSRPDLADAILVWSAVAAVCNSSSLSDTVQVCPLWPRLPGDCVNSPANLRKYPVGVFVTAAFATVPVFSLRRTSLRKISLFAFCYQA